MANWRRYLINLSLWLSFDVSDAKLLLISFYTYITSSEYVNYLNKFTFFAALSHLARAFAAATAESYRSFSAEWRRGSVRTANDSCRRHWARRNRPTHYRSGSWLTRSRKRKGCCLLRRKKRKTISQWQEKQNWLTRLARWRGVELRERACRFWCRKRAWKKVLNSSPAKRSKQKLHN